MTALATGWAVVENEQLLVATVSPTEQAAMVNWLAANSMIVMNVAAAEMISAIFEEETEHKPIRLVRVSIMEFSVGAEDQNQGERA